MSVLPNWNGLQQGMQFTRGLGRMVQPHEGELLAMTMIEKSSHEHAEALADSLSSLVITGPADTFELDTEAAYVAIMRYFGEFGLDLIDDLCRVRLEQPDKTTNWALSAGVEFRRMVGRP